MGRILPVVSLGLALASTFWLGRRAWAQEAVPAEEGGSSLVRNVAVPARGWEIYRSACLPCHGARGDGKGPSAAALDPAPRDFTRGAFKWRTTRAGMLPTDEDLERTIREGVPGTSMPAWGEVLSREERAAVIAVIKRFSPRFQDPYEEVAAEDIVSVPEARPSAVPRDPERGKEVYERMQCARCHGDRGRGDGPSAPALQDDWGRPIQAYDFTAGYYRSGRSERDLYRTFSTGLTGTPMPQYGEGTLSEEERWWLVDYITSLSRRGGWSDWLFREEPDQR